MVWWCKPLLVRYNEKHTKNCSCLSMTVSIRKGGVSHVLATTTKQIISSFLVTSSCSFIYSYTHILQGFYTFMHLPPEIYTVHDYLKGHVVYGLFNKSVSTWHIHIIILRFPMIIHSCVLYIYIFIWLYLCIYWYFVPISCSKLLDIFVSYLCKKWG